MEADESISGPPQWWLGIGFAALASFSGSLGNLLIRITHQKNVARVPQFKLPGWWCMYCPLWVSCCSTRSFFPGGMFCLVVLNTGLNLIALGFAAQSMLSPMAGVGILWNLVLSPMLLKEPSQAKDYWGAGIAMLGVTLCAISGARTSQQYTLAKLISNYQEPIFLSYFSTTLAAIAMMLVLRSHESAIGRLSTAGLGGVIGGFSSMLAKSAVEVVKQASAENTSAFGRLEAIAIIAAAILCAVFQLQCHNAALARYDALIVVPIYQCLLLISGSMTGALYFQEYRDISPMLYLSGIGLTIMGIVLISSRPTNKIKAGKH